jgi:hypothetical protein
MSKKVVEPERLQTIWRTRVACWINKATRAQAHARASAPIPTHTQMHALTRPPAHTHTHTHKATCNTYCFSTEQRLRERASLLRYTHIVCFVTYGLTFFGFIQPSSGINSICHDGYSLDLNDYYNGLVICMSDCKWKLKQYSVQSVYFLTIKVDNVNKASHSKLWVRFW